MERRHFLMTSAAAVAGRTVLASPNDTVRVACVGVHGQGRSHIRAYAAMPNVEIAAVCDVDESVLNRAAAGYRKAGQEAAGGVHGSAQAAGGQVDRRHLDRHARTTTTRCRPSGACQAGKDVYVEKPCAHNMFEARQIVAAAHKYDRIVQHGTNGRSSPVDAGGGRSSCGTGVIGDVYMSRGLCFKWRDTIGRTPVEPVPAGVHYDLWLGPAPKREFTRNRFHYNFHWFWDYGNGDIGNQGVHQMDTARWLLGVKYPTKVAPWAGTYMFDDDQETPNTLTATFEFDEGGKKKMLVFEVRHWITNGEAGIVSRGGPGSNPDVVGNIVYGSKGYLSTAGGYKILLGKEQQPGPAPEAKGGGDNWANFIQAVRSRKHSDLNAPMEEGVPSVVLIHLANISYRLGRTLHFDAATMTCTGDTEATRMFTRAAYRAPFVVPEKV